MKSAAELGLTLLGIYLAVAGVATLANLPAWIEESFPYAGAMFAATTLFRIAPGLFLLRFRSQITRLLVPSEDISVPTPSQRTFYVLGCFFLALYFGVSGVVGVIGGVVGAIGAGAVIGGALGTDYRSLVWPFFTPGLTGGLVELVAGVMIFRHARRRAALDVINPLSFPAPTRSHRCSYCQRSFTSQDPLWDQLVRSQRCPGCSEPLTV